MERFGTLLADSGTGAAFIIDDVQSMVLEDLRAFVMGLHRVAQLNLPVVAAMAGLPGSYEYVAASKGYAERMFSPLDIERAA